MYSIEIGAMFPNLALVTFFPRDSTWKRSTLRWRNAHEKEAQYVEISCISIIHQKVAEYKRLSLAKLGFYLQSFQLRSRTNSDQTPWRHRRALQIVRELGDIYWTWKLRINFMCGGVELAPWTTKKPILKFCRWWMWAIGPFEFFSTGLTIVAPWR